MTARLPSSADDGARAGAAGSLLGSMPRTGAAGPVFLLVTPDRVELRTLAWFSDYWSREDAASRWRQRRPLSFRILAPASVHPQIFSVHNERHHGHAYADGRRFMNCTATITTAPDHPADAPQRYRFRYWAYDPDVERLAAGDEPAIDDVETYALPG